MQPIRPCVAADSAAILTVINAAAEAYRGVIPDDCWQEPYMPAAKLAEEMKAGVRFRASERDGEIVAVMGMEAVRDVNLIRHAYVLPACQRSGLGGALLDDLVSDSDCRVLVGTWAAASWAVRFYERHGFKLLSADEAARLLPLYWRTSERQARASVVLAKPTQSHASDVAR